MPQLNVGDSIGAIRKIKKLDDVFSWQLVEDKITKVSMTKKYDRRYFTKSKFYPSDADDVDSNTRMMENSIGNGWILVEEIFGLNEKTRPHAERWVEWANKNINKVKGVLE